jgi:homoserine kinase type II
LYLLPLLTEEDAALLRAEIAFQANYQMPDLPQGVIHADLFRDNALFEGNELCGIIDFYYACNDALLYDVAVTVNDWCSQADGHLDCERYDTFLTHYRQQRQLTAAECALWPVMLRAAALRFWLSRLLALHFPREGEMTHIKNPNVFRDILKARLHAHPLVTA